MKITVRSSSFNFTLYQIFLYGEIVVILNMQMINYSYCTNYKRFELGLYDSWILFSRFSAFTLNMYD